MVSETGKMIRSLPPATSLSPSVISFLNAKLSTLKDLEQAPHLLLELQNQCNDLDQNLLDLNKQLENYLFDYASHSAHINGLLDDINVKVKDLRCSSHTASSSSDGGPSKIWGEELPALAKEVARVETVRKYAETALKLDTLVGDLEDAVSSTINRTLRRYPSSTSSEDMQAVAITSLKLTEGTLRLISKSQPQWTQLVSAVDHRVDRALAMLRPQAIADHRSLLASLGWPPPLSTSKSSGLETKKSINVHNPLVTMQGELKQKYCESFLTLCSLQELQRQRKSRQIEGIDRYVDLHQPLWAIEELVSPISVACQQHFSKWIDQPEFIFALVYKVTQDYVDSMDELLQPLVDEAMLSGYSCREEWIAAMVTSLCMYLVKEVFPRYTSLSDEEGVTGRRSNARASWLFLIDQMIGFDKKVQSLVSQSGISLSLQEDGLQKLSSLSVFGDRPDWLDLWAEIELDDSLDKLKPDIMDERNWSNEVQDAALLLGQGGTKSPAITSSFLRCLSAVIDRCRSLPTVPLRSRFLNLVGPQIIDKFFDSIVLRSQEAEGLTALTDDAALTKVARCINASRYFEAVLKEWCEDVFFLEMRLDCEDLLETLVESCTSHGESPGNGFFYWEIKKLEEFRKEWAEVLSTVVLRGFDVCCREYLKNKKHWQEKEEGHIVSQSFVTALDYLQGKMSVLAEVLNEIDFVGVWRSLASRIDTLVFNGVLWSNTKFSDGGVERLDNDMGVLFGVFRQWCIRPEGFFPKLSEGIKLLKMTKKQLQDCLKGGEISLKENGIRQLTVAEAEKIVRNRV
ncbi:unnamed protein product [Cuscuta epithymum]|uniref:RINT1-like protein MAG2 n=2 Tax=Cuscuta epithymum TaxID=186058 RepID=A0AAV0DF38_9ASTE|nr:unnamed protein product [Cuscuta epithymum]